jgi:uncharacterized protein (TIGR02466 family)
MAGLFFRYYNINMQTLDFNTVSLFPTIIGGCVNVPLAKKVLPFAKEVLGNQQNLTNYWNYKNTYSNFNIPRTSVYKELESFILDVSRSFTNSHGFFSKTNDIELFFSDMGIGDYHSTHAHPLSSFSGVFYLNVPENSSSIRFHDPRPYKDFTSYSLSQNYLTHDINPQVGLFLIWQSWIPHEVLKNYSDGRITAVFNIL